MSAGNALAVYPQLARGLLGSGGSSAETVERYAEQLAFLIGLLERRPTPPPP
ncbi:hypothetical protein ACFQ0B_14010 [Nonomuraea thailandensis]